MPEAAVAPAPAAPAAAQAAPDLSQPSKAPAVPDAAGSDAFAALDALATESPGDSPAAPEKNGDRVRRPDGTFTPKPDDKGKAAPSDRGIPKPGDKSPEPADDTNLKAGELRRRYDDQKKTIAKITKEFEDFKKTASQPKEDPEKKTLSEKLSAYEKRMAEKEKREQELEEKLRFTDYKESDEYKEKYEKPFVDAWGNGANRVAALKVVEKKDAEGDVIRESRQGTAKDFEKLMGIADDDEAAEFAADLFGAKAPTVLYHREKINELNQAGHKAIEEHRKTGGERQKQMSKQLEEQSMEIAKHFDASRKADVEKYGQWFKPDEADPKGNELLEKGNHLVNRAFSDGRPLREGDKPLDAKGVARIQAVMANKAAGFDRLAMRERAAQKRISELEADLAKYKESEPGPGDGGGRGAQPAPSDETALGAFDATFGKK